ncbi:MAG: MASE1 domain-containing protein [Gemmatimonadaceae bacterium]|jgi:PAS domain S-box-containing protein|nr:MASE1 domain-containing protein [Gemmatimonadaceae bacterium]
MADSPVPAPPTRWPLWLAVVAGVGYAALAQLCLLLDVPQLSVAVMWLPSGLLVGVLAVSPMPTWWRWLAVQAPFHVLPNLLVGRSLPISVGYTIANLIEAVVAAWLLQRLGGAPVTLAHVRDVVGRLFPAGAAGAAVSAIMAAGIAAVTDSVTSPGRVAGIWFGAVLLGILVVAPFVIALHERGRGAARIPAGQAIESVIVLVLLVTGGVVAFAQAPGIQSVPLLYLPYPVLIWSALRLAPTVTSLGTFLLAAIAAWFTVRGMGPLTEVAADVGVRVLWLQGYVLVTVVMTLLITAEVEDRRQAMRDLAAREAQYALVTSHAQDVIGMTDERGHYAWMSPAALHITGYHPDELVGLNAYAFIHPDDQEAVRTAAERIRHSTTPGTFRYRGKHKDGTWRWVEVNAAVANPDVSPAERHLVTVTREISAQKALESELARARTLEGVGRMASGLAHDFNNILTAILGGLESARSDPRGSAAVREELALVEQAADRGRQITRQLLNIARRAPDAPTVGDVDALVRSAMPVLRTLVGANVTVQEALGGGLPPVRMDAGQVHQVLLNLAANARDAMQGRGTLTVRSATLHWLDGDPARPLSLPPGRYVTLSMEDTGPGVPDELRERIFEPFFTTKDAGEGTGLGLASAFGIARQHSGLLWCDSAPGRGARFMLALPAIEQRVGTAGSAGSAAQATAA